MASDNKTERTEVSAVPLYQQVMDDLKGEIADGHAVAQKALFDGMEGVDGGAIGVEDDQLVAVRIGSHTRKLNEQCDGFVTLAFSARQHG